MDQVVKGRVLEKDSGVPIPGVPVSNGETIVPTSADGSFSIDLDSGHRFVYLSIPDTHRADGSFFMDAATVRSNPKEIEFALVPAPEKSNRAFSFVQISDIHVIESQSFRTIDRGSLRFYSSRETLSLALHQIEQEATPAFIVPTGDLTHRGTDAELSACHDAFGTIATPVFALFAGHDGSEEHFKNGDGVTATGNFERLFGPTHYSFDWGGRHFVLFTDEDLMFSAEDTSDLSSQPADRDIYVFVHCPPSQELLDRLAAYNVKMVSYGHYHASKLQRVGDIDVVGTPPATFAGMDTSPRGFRYVQCGAEGHRLDFRPLASHATSSSRTGRKGAIGPWRLEWNRELPATNHRAKPVVSDGLVLLSQQDETHDGHDGIVALDADSGERRYHAVAETAVKNSVAISDNGVAAALTIAGKLHVFDTRTGVTRWERELPGHPLRWLYTTPVVHDGVVYAGGKAGCGAFDIEDGSEQWYTTLQGDFDFQPCYASPQVFEDLLVVPLQGKGMAALRLSDGNEEWKSDFRGKYQSASPRVAGELLATGGNYTDLGVLKAATGDVVWQFPFEHKYVCALTADDTSMYAGTPTGELQCYDLRTGEHRWTFRVGDDLMDFSPYQMGVRTILAEPVFDGNHLLVGGCDGWLYVVDTETGACSDQGFFGAPITSAPSLAGDRLYVATYDRKVYCLAAQ